MEDNINYTVILFQTPREALNTIFEGFPWSQGLYLYYKTLIIVVLSKIIEDKII